MHPTGPHTQRRAMLSLALIGSLLALILAQFTLLAPARPTQAARANDPVGSLPRLAPQVPSTSLVISQIYGGGGNSGASFTNDFIELFNKSALPVILTTTWSVQYASATGSNWAVTQIPTGTTLQPGQYLLVQEASGGAVGAPLPTPEIAGTINLSAANGKVALVSNTTPLTCGLTQGSCSAVPSVVDFVGYGTTALDYEGAGRAPVGSNTSSVLRVLAGCQDTDNNTADFTTASPPTPRNTSSPLNPCVVGNTATPTVTQTIGSATATPTAGSATTTATTASTATATSTATPGIALRIRDVQGLGHISPYNGQVVSNIQGIVTGLRSNGFYMQDALPDSNDATDEGILVFTAAAPPPAVVVGAAVSVNATVSEFRATGRTADLTVTELGSPTITVLTSGNPVPTPVVLGTGGRIPPMMTIEDDACGDVETGCNVFDPATDGIDFYESLEGMLVQVNNPVSVSPTNSFGELWVLGDDGANASVRTTRGGIVIRDTDMIPDNGNEDFNPERILLASSIAPVPAVHVGAHFSNAASGPMDYGFGNYRVQITQALVVASNPLTREVTTPQATNELAVANFNLENLAGNEPQLRFDQLSALIVTNLKSPDLLVIEEIQDNNGATNDGTVDASTTWNRLIAAITAAGGPAYIYRQIDPVNNQDGGQPGGNIRQGFLFRTDRGLSFIDRAGGTSTNSTTVMNFGGQAQLTFSPGRIDPTNSAWQDSRKPLAGEFLFNGQHLIVIGNHFASKGGDDPLFGRHQPAVRSSEVKRHQQAQIENDFVDTIDAVDVGTKVIVAGDINDYQFSQTMDLLRGVTPGPPVLNDLIESLPLSERYSYVFDGNSQALDHILASPSLTSGTFFYDMVHINAEFSDQLSDHDAEVARFSLPQLTATPTGTIATATTTATAVANTTTPTATSILPTITITVLPPSATRTSTTVPSVTQTQTAVGSTATQTQVANTATATRTSTGTVATVTLTVVPPSATRTQTTVPSVTITATATAVLPTTTLTVLPPSVTQTATSPPVATQTATSQPVATQTATSQPLATQTATSQPAATQTATSVPTATRTATRVPTATVTAVATDTPCTIHFTDVTDPTAYYYQGVYYLACHGVISGYSDGTFKPFNNTTRGQMTKIVTLAFNIALVTPPALENRTFTDVTPDNVFYQLIETAAARQIVSGYSCGGVNAQTGAPEPCDSARRPYFRPSNFVTRGQLAKIVVLGAAFPLINPPTPTFTDVARDNVFYQSIETAVCHGIISGYSDQTFRPTNYAFRGQIAKIVYLAVTNPQATCPARAVR
ncbi:MAG: S-layer homology domain-containing protein [Chloroflexota bacterium]|nr:S-layer homology domain-containing protein [Chloroflexota bacterium]